MLKAFLKFRADRANEERFRQETLFAESWATPPSSARQRSRLPDDPRADSFVSWDEVQSFLQMAEQALKVRGATNEALSAELQSEKEQKCRVEKTSSAAQEESSFLADSMQSLLDERAALKDALERAQREREHLTQENELLRQELLDGAALGEESSAAMHLLARQAEELQTMQRRNAELENDNVQLQARVSALERAHRAQSTAMLSCLEESERVRLQQLTISLPESPLGPLAHHLRSDEGGYTDDGSAGGGGGYADALDSSGSFVSCVTPLTAGSGGSRSGGGGGGSHLGFCSPEPSPHEHKAAQQQQQQKEQQQQQRPQTPGT